jgi:hypothetical protein
MLAFEGWQYISAFCISIILLNHFVNELTYRLTIFPVCLVANDRTTTAQPS